MTHLLESFGAIHLIAHLCKQVLKLLCMKRPVDQLKYSPPMKIVHKMQQRNDFWAIVAPEQASETEKEACPGPNASKYCFFVVFHVHFLLETNISVDCLIPLCITVIVLVHANELLGRPWDLEWACHHCIYYAPFHLHEGVRYPT